MAEGRRHSREEDANDSREDASESKKSKRDPTTIAVAIIGAIGVISAALIGLLIGARSFLGDRLAVKSKFADIAHSRDK
jgi:F0F1-type ATP synthase assembly protein I